MIPRHFFFCASALLALQAAPALAAVDADRCQDSVDRMGRRTRDASEIAERYRTARPGQAEEQLKRIQAAIKDTQAAVEQARKDCGMGLLPGLPSLPDGVTFTNSPTQR